MSVQDEFFNKIKDGAIKGWNTHKILPSVSLAQSALESNWGKSELATKGNNLFGIKPDSGWTGKTITVQTSEFVNKKWIKVDAPFRKYDSWSESVADHGEFFTSSDWRKNNYKTVIGEKDYKKSAKALQSSGYATDPKYAEKLIKIIEEYNLNKWDNLKEEESKMPTFLFIAGHGENKNGSFDPGATGIIKKGEHKYFEEDLFPAIKKLLPPKSNIVLYSAHNVYDYNDVVALAKKYGSDTVVIEWHYDAGSPSASGGHVIIHNSLSPDKYDLAIRDVIKKHIGVRYIHRNQAGISGRTNLGNCNRAKTAGINYRLVELGFGTNSKDANAMVKNVDAIAKDIVIAFVGKVAQVAQVQKKEEPKVTNKTVAKNPDKEGRSTAFKRGDKVKLSATAKSWLRSSTFDLGSFKSTYEVDWLNVDGTIYISPVGADWGGNVLESDIEMAPNNDIQKDDIVTLRPQATHWFGGSKLTDGMKKAEYSVRERVNGNTLYIDNGTFRGIVYDWDAVKK